MDASEHPPFPATLRPTSKTRVAVLASLTMATLVFSVGFGNIFIRTVANHVNDKNCYVPTHSYTKNRHFVSTHVTITYVKMAIRNIKWHAKRLSGIETGETFRICRNYPVISHPKPVFESFFAKT